MRDAAAYVVEVADVRAAEIAADFGPGQRVVQAFRVLEGHAGDGESFGTPDVLGHARDSPRVIATTPMTTIAMPEMVSKFIRSLKISHPPMAAPTVPRPAHRA